MRAIKFRAWVNKAMQYDVGVHPHIAERHDEGSFTLCPAITGDDIPVMQFIGLHDKNSKEIYEGDIVRGEVRFPQQLTGHTNENSNFKMCGEVFYDHSHFSLRAIQSMCASERPGMVNYFDFIGRDCEVFEDMEVIGNIYENSDLLKV